MPDRAAEIALARSAAPDSISRHATVLMLGSRGYERAVEGTNGFVCTVAFVDGKRTVPKEHRQVRYLAPGCH